MTDSNPTMRRRQLGAELARLRDAAGKTQDEAGAWIGIPGTSISRIETGKRKINVGHLRLLLQLYGVGSPHAEALHELARQSAERGWWTVYGDTVPPWFADFLGMETAAVEILTYESEYISGLFQTEGYVRAIAAMASREAGRYLELRATRQKRLTDPEPLRLRAVLNEAVVRREVGGPDVMREQVAHLREVASLPHVTVQLLPFSAGAHPGMPGSFSVLGFAEDPMNTVYVELDGGALYMEKPSDVERYAASFERISALALNEKDTVSLLEEIERRY